VGPDHVSDYRGNLPSVPPIQLEYPPEDLRYAIPKSLKNWPELPSDRARGATPQCRSQPALGSESARRIFHGGKRRHVRVGPTRPFRSSADPRGAETSDPANVRRGSQWLV